jgi:hypothetical protein
LGKTPNSLGKTSPQAVDKFKRDCGISGGYLKRKISEGKLKLFWEVTEEITILTQDAEDLGGDFPGHNHEETLIYT